MKTTHIWSFVKLIMATLVFSSSMAYAQGFYLAGHVGQSKIDIDGDLNRSLQSSFSQFSSNVDDEDTGYKLLLGYRFNPYLSIEGGYGDYGKANVDVNSRIPAATIKGDFETTAWLVDVVGTWPVADRFSVYGKVGMARWEVKTNFTTSILNGPVLTGGEKETGQDFKWALGAAYNFTKNLSLRLEYEQFEAGDSNKTGKGDISLLSLGLAYHF